MAEAPRLKPLKVIEILDRSFQLYRENFALSVGVLAVLQIPASIIQLFITGSMSDEIFRLTQEMQAGNAQHDPAIPMKLMAAGGVSWFVSMLILGITVPLETGALTRAISSRYLNEPTSIGACYSYVFKIFWQILGTILLSGLVTMLGMFMCLVPGFLFLVWFIFSSSIVVLEGLAGTAAMGRSKQLSEGHRWRIVGMGLCILLIGIVLGMGIGALNQFLLPKLTMNPVRQAVLGQALQQILNLLLAPFSSIAWILLYYDLRIRKEGFDLEVLAKSMSAPKGFFPPPQKSPPAPPAPMQG